MSLLTSDALKWNPKFPISFSIIIKDWVKRTSSSQKVTIAAKKLLCIVFISKFYRYFWHHLEYLLLLHIHSSADIYWVPAILGIFRHYMEICFKKNNTKKTISWWSIWLFKNTCLERLLNRKRANVVAKDRGYGIRPGFDLWFCIYSSVILDRLLRLCKSSRLMLKMTIINLIFTVRILKL